MLVIISDLHFVDGTAGEHNLPVDAFRDVFFEDIIALAKDKNAKEVKLLLLGDIIDLIRSEQWFAKRGGQFDLADRPWGMRGLGDVHQAVEFGEKPANTPTEQRCLDILGRFPADRKKPSRKEDTVLYKNWETFALFRGLKRHLRRRLRSPRLPVDLIYVPGNHDRLVNLYPAVRDEVQRILGLTVDGNTVLGDPNKEWVYRTDFMDTRYGVYARHGHQYDPYNFAVGEDHSLERHLQATIGDVVTTEFAVKIPWQLAQIRKKNKDITPGLIKSLKDMDNVRPLSQVMEWFYYRIRDEDRNSVGRALDKAFDAVVGGLLKIRFVQQWESPDTRWDELVRVLSNRWLRWIPNSLLTAFQAEDLLPRLLGILGGGGSADEDKYAQAAYNEQIWRTHRKINHIVYGHTHRPVQVPLDRDRNREIIYINTGTWRERINRTISLDKAPDFAKTKQMTYVVFYSADEDMNGKKRGTVSFDIWTGSRRKY
jgi:UDP-2,3-diacylglucosamine pyrophosphatase LpxH